MVFSPLREYPPFVGNAGAYDLLEILSVFPAGYG